MFTFTLQERTTLVFKAGASVSVQDEPGWLDLSGYQDLVLWTEVSAVSASGASSFSLDFQTAPDQNDEQFQTMTSINLLTVTAGQVNFSPVLAHSASTPLARFVRWSISLGGGVDARVTFRAYISANLVTRAIAAAPEALRA